MSASPEDAISSLKVGISCLKTGTDGKTRQSVVSLSQDERQLSWTGRKKGARKAKTKRAILLADVVKLESVNGPNNLTLLVPASSGSATARTPRGSRANLLEDLGLKHMAALVLSAEKRDDGAERFQLLVKALHSIAKLDDICSAEPLAAKPEPAPPEPAPRPTTVPTPAPLDPPVKAVPVRDTSAAVAVALVENVTSLPSIDELANTLVDQAFEIGEAVTEAATLVGRACEVAINSTMATAAKPAADVPSGPSPPFAGLCQALTKCMGSIPSTTPTPPPPLPASIVGFEATPEVEAAALAVQKVYRGFNAREAQEEKRRVHHLQSHFDRGEWDEALYFAVLPAEIAMVEEAKANAESVARPPPASVARDESSAVIMVQKMYRSHASRDAQEEKRRVFWLNEFMARGEWEQALSMTTMPEEEQEVYSRRAAAQSATKEEAAAVTLQNLQRKRAAQMEVEEKRRAFWLNEHVARGEWAEAAAMAVTPAEEAMVETAQTEAVSRGGGAEGRTEEEAAAALVESTLDSAISAEDATKEEAAAVTLQNLQRKRAAQMEVEEKRRAFWLNEHVARGEWAEAAAMAVTPAEEAMVEIAKGKAA